MAEHEKYDAKYVARVCGISVSTARRLMKEGRIRTMNITGRGSKQHLRTLPEYVEEFKREEFRRAPRIRSLVPRRTRRGTQAGTTTVETQRPGSSSGVVVTDTPYQDPVVTRTTHGAQR
ncbi:MAG TPA: hypothetical protein VHI13_05345 [Candidatus Kapabacteria bacterium]|nr:hypothetical protein [Candidatus Kapabacteria bacterium]